MSEKQALIQQIEAAFRDTEYPGDDNISDQYHCEECAELTEVFRGKHWLEVVDVIVLRQYDLALALLKPEGFRFYLPAYMQAVLIHPDEAEIIYDHLISNLTPPVEEQSKNWAANFKQANFDHFLSRVTGFSKNQQAVIAVFLKQISEDGYEAYIKRALAFWESADDQVS